jgi:hypothetical protein
MREIHADSEPEYFDPRQLARLGPWRPRRPEPAPRDHCATCGRPVPKHKRARFRGILLGCHCRSHLRMATNPDGSRTIYIPNGPRIVGVKRKPGPGPVRWFDALRLAGFPAPSHRTRRAALAARFASAPISTRAAVGEV